MHAGFIRQVEANAGACRGTEAATPGRRRGRGRVRPGCGTVSGAGFRHHRNRNRVLRGTGTGNRNGRQRAPDHDGAGAVCKASTRPSSSRPFAPRSTACSIATAVSTSTSKAIRRLPPSTLRKPIDTSGNLQTGSFGYKPGGPGDIVVVRMMYEWPVYVSLLGLNLSDMASSKRLLMSTVAFRNEPYQ